MRSFVSLYVSPVMDWWPEPRCTPPLSHCQGGHAPAPCDPQQDKASSGNGFMDALQNFFILCY